MAYDVHIFLLDNFVECLDEDVLRDEYLVLVTEYASGIIIFPILAGGSSDAFV